MSNGATYKVKSPFPQKVIRLRKDQLTNPKLNPMREAEVIDEDSELAKFKKRYGNVFSLKGKPDNADSEPAEPEAKKAK